MNPKIYFYYLIIILISFSCHSPTDGDGGTTTTGGDGGTTTTGGNDCGECPISLSFGNISENSIEIVINTPLDDLGGFQFDISGISTVSASGGLAEQYGFTVSTSTEGGSTVLGFSIMGDVIPAGSNGILTHVYYSTYTNTACLINVTLSDPNGNAIDYDLGDCY